MGSWYIEPRATSEFFNNKQITNYVTMSEQFGDLKENHITYYTATWAPAACAKLLHGGAWTEGKILGGDFGVTFWWYLVNFSICGPCVLVASKGWNGRFRCEICEQHLTRLKPSVPVSDCDVRLWNRNGNWTRAVVEVWKLGIIFLFNFWVIFRWTSRSFSRVYIISCTESTILLMVQKSCTTRDP